MKILFGLTILYIISFEVSAYAQKSMLRPCKAEDNRAYLFAKIIDQVEGKMSSEEEVQVPPLDFTHYWHFVLDLAIT